jgi:hypothetical protein
MQAASIMAMMGSHTEYVPKEDLHVVSLNKQSEIFAIGSRYYKDSFLEDPWQSLR